MYILTFACPGVPSFMSRKDWKGTFGPATSNRLEQLSNLSLLKTQSNNDVGISLLDA